jgi:hypothetical protein
MTHLNQLKSFFNFLSNEKIRYVVIRGFLKLPITADTDLDIIIHPDDFQKCISNMQIKSKNKTFSINLITECIYEPCLTTGAYNNKMSNGCFRIDLYNNIFFHCGRYKYQLPLFFLDILFNSINYKIPETDTEIKIPTKEMEILLLICRAIIDKNGKKIQEKHIERIEFLIKSGINNKLLNTFINAVIVSDNSGQLNECINKNYFKGYCLNECIKNKDLNDLNEESLISFSYKTNYLLAYTAIQLNKISTYVEIKNTNEYKYLYDKKNQPYFWKYYGKMKFDNLIAKYDEKKYNNIDVCCNYQSNYRHVWYDPFKMKYIPYYYLNNKCNILGEFDTPKEASDCYNNEANKKFGYTLNKSKIVKRNNLDLQIRDGIHRSVINFGSNINMNLVYNLGRRPQSIPLEHEFHSFILWNNNNKLKEILLDYIEKAETLNIEKIEEMNIINRYTFVNNIYLKERKFYNFKGDVPNTDSRIRQNSNITLIIITDIMPNYIDFIKQGKNLPLNNNIKMIKNVLRDSFNCYEFHSTDNISEHNAIIETLFKNEKKDFLVYMN